MLRPKNATSVVRRPLHSEKKEKKFQRLGRSRRLYVGAVLERLKFVVSRRHRDKRNGECWYLI